MPNIYIFGPLGFERPVTLEKVAEGAFRGRVRIDSPAGASGVRALVETPAFRRSASTARRRS